MGKKNMGEIHVKNLTIYTQLHNNNELFQVVRKKNFDIRTHASLYSFWLIRQQYLRDISQV